MNEEIYNLFKERDEELNEELFTSGFSLTLYGAFSSESEYYGKDIIETLYKLVLEMEMEDFFSGIVRIVDYKKEDNMIPKVEEYFDEEFFKGKISKETKKWSASHVQIGSRCIEEKWNFRQ